MDGHACNCVLATIAPEQGQCRASFTDTSGNVLVWILVRAFRRGMLYYLCDRYGIHPDDLRILLLVVCMGIAFFVGIGLWKQGGSTSRNLLELLEDGVVTFEEELAAWRASIWSRT